MRFSPVSPAKSQRPSHTRTASINLGSLGQISSSLWLNHSASPYAAYGVVHGPTPGAATQPSAYPLALAAIQTALEFLDPGCRQNSDFFRAPQTTTARPTAWDSPALGTPAKDPTPPRQPRGRATLHQPAPGGTALTLSAPIAGAGNLILAARNPSRATNPLAQAKAPTRAARQKVVVRHSWLRTATKSPAFALSSAAINGLMLVSPLVSLAQTTTTYGTGGSSAPYTGGIINPGDTVILNDGATVSGADPITANGTLQFNQTTNLTITNNLTGSGSLALINTGNLTLTYNDTVSGIGSINAFDLGISLTQGSLLVGANGGNRLAIGSVSNGTLAIAGGTVQDTYGYLGLSNGSNGTATVSAGGTWTNTNDLAIGKNGNSSLTVDGGSVSAANSLIGVESSGNGTATISSGGWTNTGALIVGTMGRGNLILSGGTISNAYAIIGSSLGASGAAAISGGNWTTTGTLAVGSSGNGSLVISGGNISNATALLGFYGAGIAAISGGNWTNSADLFIGYFSNGTLAISGGNVSNRNGTIGLESGSIGSVTVSGGNWTNSGNLTVGGSGTANLTITGGMVKVAGTLSKGANGTINLNEGGTLSIGNLTLPDFSFGGALSFNSSTNVATSSNLSGTGSLIKEGSNTLTLSGNNTYTGPTSIDSGTLLVSGLLADSTNLTVATGATYQLGQTDTIGSIAGNGTINLDSYNLTAGGANASTTFSGQLVGSGAFTKAGTGNLTLAYNTTISGPYGPNREYADIANINAFDLGISLTQGSLFVGADGGNGLAIGSVSNGTLTIAGGTVKNTDGYLGLDSGSNGTATVATGGTWTNTGNLTVGFLGNGTLTVSGGNVSNVNGVIGVMGGNYNNTIAGSNGIVTISGGNWTNSGDLTVGAYGNGTLAMSGGNISNVNSVIGEIGKSFDNDWYGSNGIVTISGGNWTNSGSITVGKDSIGALTVSGGNVSSASARIGNDSSTAIISGGNWTNSGDFQVGNSNLTINGGLLTVGGTISRGAAGNINLNAGGTLSIVGVNGSLAGDLAYKGTLVFNRTKDYSYDSILSGSGSLIKEGDTTLTFKKQNAYTGNTTISAGVLYFFIKDNGSISSSSNIINNALLDVQTNSGFIQTYGGQISGSGALIKRQSGTLILSGNNTYTGQTELRGGGTLQIGNGGTSGSLVSNVSGGPLVFNRSDSSTYGGVFSGSTVTKLGAGTLTLTGNNNSGTTTISAGTLQIGAGGTSGSLGSNIINNANLAFNRSDNISFSSEISGTGNLTQLGAGTLTITGINTYTGTTTISAGTLQIGAGGNSGGISNSSTIANNANLAFDRSNDYTYGGLISGTGTLAKLGAGTLILSGNNTYTGTTTNSAGTLQIGAGGTSGAISNTSSIANNANLAFSRSDATTYAGIISGSGSLAKQGSGTLTLSGNNIYTGNTTIDSGTLLVSGLLADSSNVSVSQGATYQLGSTDTIGSISGNGAINLDGYHLTAGGSNGNTTFGGVMAGTGAFAKAGLGTLTLTGTNTYTGETTISDGTLQIGSGGTSGSISNSATITNNANLAFNRSDAMTYGGLISGTGNLNQLGAGTLTLTGNNTYTGNTTVGDTATLRVEGSIAPSSGLVINNGATLSGNGTVTATTINAGGILAPNNAGSSPLAITGGSGNLTLAFGSISNFSIDGGNSDRVTASGSINLDGVLNLAFSGDNYLTSAPYTLFSGQSLSGTFAAANVQVSGLSSAYQYALDYTATALNLQVFSVIPEGQSSNITSPSSTTLSGGTLVINQPGSYNTSLVLTTPANANVTSTIDGNGVTAELSGTISGNGSLAISNSQNSTTTSNTNLTGNSTYTGSTTVENGANLFVNGSIAASANLTIQAGASIGGNGTLPMTTVQSGGSIAAGNSIGNLTVSGNLALNSGSYSRFEVGSASADRLSVTGSSALGGNVTLAFSGGNYDAVNPYTLVAAQSITTPFDVITTTGDLTGYRYNLTYNPTTVQLALAKVLDTGMTTSISNPWSSTLAGGTVSVDANGSFANNWTLSAPSGSSATTFEQSGSVATLQGVISGPGDLTIAANAAGGTLILAGNNSYTGNSNLSGGTIGLASASALGKAGTISLTGGTLLYGTGNTTDYSDRFSHGANQSYNVNTNGQVVTFASALDSHGGTLTKEGDGTLILSGNNTYTGVTTIQAGTLQVGSGSNTGAISDASSIVNHATLAFGLSNATTYAGQISGSGSLAQIGLGTLALSGLNSYTGATTITSGSTLALWGSGSIGTSSGVSNSGNFSIAAATSPVTLINLSGSGSTNLGNQSLTISEASGLNSGVISGQGGALSLNGTGTYSLSGINTYTGATTIGSGETLALEGSGSIATSSGVFNSGNFSIAAATSPASVTNLTGTGGTTLGNQSLTITDASGLNSGVISGQGGSLTLNGTGTYSLSGVNTYTGATTIGIGETLALEGSGSIAASSGVFNSGNLSIAAATSPVTIINLTGSGGTNLGNQSLTITDASGLNGGVISGLGGTLAINGTGTYSLSGVNTHTGATTIGSGETLALEGSGSIAASSGVFNSGNLSIAAATSPVTIINLTGSGGITLGNQSLTISEASGLNSGVISGQGGALSLNGTGTYSLSGINTYTGATTIGSGETLVLEGSGSIAASSGVFNSGNFSIAAATSPVTLISLSGSGSTNLGNQSLTISEASGLNSGVISGSGGALTLNGTGTYSLSGINTYTGATTIGSGETLALEGSGSIAASSGVLNSGNFSIAGATSPVSLINLNGSGSTTLGNQSLTISEASGLNSGVISGQGGALSLNGTGTYSLSGINTYTGATTIGSGETLALEGSGSIAASSGVLNSGNLSIAAATSPTSVTNLTGTGSTNLGNQSLTITDASGLNSGVISGLGGSLAINGSGTYSLSGINTYTGATSLGGPATLQVSGSIAPSSALTVTSGATLAGNGTLPATSISAGAILAPQNAGSSALSVAGASGNLSLASGSISNFSILATTSDRVAATGTITLDGSLNLAFSADSYLTATPYVLFSGQSLRGSFGSVAVSGLSSFYVYSLDYGANALNLWVAASVPEGEKTDITAPTATTLSGGTILINEPGAYNTSLVLTNPPGSSTNTIDANGLTAVLSGTISGTGPITFINSLNSSANSDIILSGNNTYTGATVVDTGVRLSVNGSIASSANLTVNGGAIVGGHGSLPATTIQSGGLLAPGNSIGRLTASSLSFGPGGLVDLEIQGPQNDKTIVTGSVTNFTGTANLIAYGGGTPWPNLDYQLITATNNFATSSRLSLNPVGITSALLLQGTTLVQEVDGNGQTFDVMWRPNNGSGATASAMQSLGQGNRNQLAAAGVFDSAFQRLAVAAADAPGVTTGLNATGTAIGSTGFTTGQAAAAGLSPAFLTTTAQLLALSSTSQLSAAISTLGPQSYAAFQSVGLETLQRQRQQLLGSAGQCASNGWVINGPTSNTAKAAKNPICLYGQAANANSSITGQDGLSGYNVNLFSSFYGLEVKANPYWNFGAAYGYGTSNLNGLGPTNAWVTATVNSGSLYGVYVPTTTSPWTFKGLLGYGNYALNGSRRVASIGTGSAITGSTTANGLTAALTAEVAIPLTKASAPVPVLLKPLFGLAYGNYQQAGFSETGGGPLNLNVDGNTASSLVGTIGLELTSGPIPLNRAKTLSLIPRVALAYQVDALASELGNSSLSASMPASGAGAFLTQGQNRGVNGFTVAAGVDLILTKSTALYANVNVEAFSAGSQVGYGGGLRFKF